LLAGSQLETNKKAMNIQVRTIPQPPPLGPCPPICLSVLPYPTLPYPVPTPLVCHLFLSKFGVRQGWVSPDSLGFQATPSGFGTTSGHPRRDSHPSPLLMLLLLTRPDPFYLLLLLLQAVDSSGLAEY
jgi:hypothetical protein